MVEVDVYFAPLLNHPIAPTRGFVLFRDEKAVPREGHERWNPETSRAKTKCP